MRLYDLEKSMIPEYPKFTSLKAEQLPLVNQYLEQHSSSNCELSLANLFIYRQSDRPQLTLINGNLCIMIDPFIEPCFFLEPLGQEKIEATAAVCLNHCGRISRAAEKLVGQLTQADYHIKCLRNQFDYIYLTYELAELKGRKFDGKRNHINRFLRHFPSYNFLPLQASHKKEALRLFHDWLENKGDNRHFSKLAFSSQKLALEAAFDNFQELKLSGGAIEIDGKLSGFVLGSRLNQQTVDLHFLYGNPAIAGIPQILLQQACAKTFANYKYINQEQDLGIPGLRKAKLSYYPHHLEKKFEIKAK